MKRIYILYALILISAGCSRKMVSPVIEKDRGARADNRYDYILTEAIRQKYLGDPNEAANLFEKCIELDKKRAVPWFELAQMYSAAGIGEKALLYSTTAARLEPDNYWYQLACGSLYTQYEIKDSAIVYFTRAIMADRSAIEVNGILAGLYAEKGETAKADSLFLILDKEGSLNPEMSQMMIFSLVNNGDLKEAAARTSKLIKQYPEDTRYRALLADIYNEDGLREKSDSIYREIIDKEPDNIESQLLYLMSLVNKKEYSGISLFLNNIFKSDVIEKERKIAVAQRLAGDTLFVKENADSFAVSLVLLESVYKGDDEVNSLRPGVYEMVDQKEKAIARYEEIIKEAKPLFWFKERLLILYAEVKDYQKLYNLASVYSRENNRSLLGKIYYAIAAMELSHYDVAENELNKALILAGNNDEIKVQVMSMMGDLKYRMKDFKSSYELYESALNISPEDPLILNNYAYFIAEGDGDLKKALRMAEKVMTLEGNNPTYIDTYAWVLFKLGRYREAHREMLKIFGNSNGERDPEVLEHMGFILKKLGNCTEAVDFWKEAVEKDGSKTYLTEEIEKCRK